MMFPKIVEVWKSGYWWRGGQCSFNWYDYLKITPVRSHETFNYRLYTAIDKHGHKVYLGAFIKKAGFGRCLNLSNPETNNPKMEVSAKSK